MTATKKEHSMVSMSEYQTRRRHLAMQLPKGAVALIPAASECLRNGDAHYRFRQDSDFYYLTGFNEPDGLLIITAGKKSESVLFNRARNFAEEQWTGFRLGQEGACEQLGVDCAYSLTELEKILPQYLANRSPIFFPIGRYPVWDQHFFAVWKILKGQVRQGVHAAEAFADVSPILGEMRLFKSDAELQCIREVAHISVAAHQRAMQAASWAKYEYQLEAEIIHELTRQGARNVAYDSIVAGGRNACVLHYTDNNQTLRSGDLVLIDAGGEVQNYAADITRTFPLNGRFSPEQKLIYELVLSAQKAGISRIRPGCLWDEIQQAIVGVLTTGLKDLGILQGSVDDLIEAEAYRPFYMHRSGHWLGLDVHDVGRYKENGQWRALEAGMVLTVEPGLYIHESIQGIDSRWHGIGVRIEDDICVTQSGHENLTAALATEVNDVEALIRG